MIHFSEKIFHIKTKISENLSLGNNRFFKLSFVSDKISKYSLAGQFLFIDCGHYLRRPFSISNVVNNKIEIIYKCVGKGSNFLSKMKKGEKVDVIGPLGNGFPISKKYILIGGGRGLAPLRFLSKYSGVLFYGAKTKTEIVGIEIFKKNNWEIKISTDDGSAGFKGNVIKLFENFLKKNKNFTTPICACGPLNMFLALNQIVQKYKINNCFVSVENRLACGLGLCSGCVIKTTSGYKKVCKDGPVFNIKEILWEEFPNLVE